MPTGTTSTDRRFPRHRLNPYKVLAILLYSRVAPVIRLGGEGQVVVRIGPLARLLHVPNARLHEYIKWLEKHNFLTVTSDLAPGELALQVNPPSLFPSTVATTEAVASRRITLE
jgi:hypothetical protein